MTTSTLRNDRTFLPFALLSTGTLAAGIGNGITMVALPWLVLERTGSASAAAVVAAAAALPLLFASMLSGVIVDRVGRRRVSILSDVLSAGSVMAIPLLDMTVGLTVAMLAILAALGATFDPAGITARETLLPAAAGRAGLTLDRANGIFEAVYNGAYLVGPGVGGLLLATIGATGTLWFSAVGFGISIVAIALAQVPEPVRAPATRGAAGFWRDTAEGIRFVRDHRLLRTATLYLVILTAFWLPLEGVLLPAWFTEQGEPTHLGLVVTSLSVGGLIGALAWSRWSERLRRRPVFIGALLISGIGIMALATLPPLIVLLVIGAILGVAYGPVNPIINTVIQSSTPEALRGRVTGVVISLTYAAGPLGYLLAGPLVDGLGIGMAFLLIGGLALVTMLPAVFTRTLRELDALDVSAGTDHLPPADRGQAPGIVGAVARDVP